MKRLWDIISAGRAAPSFRCSSPSTEPYRIIATGPRYVMAARTHVHPQANIGHQRNPGPLTEFGSSRRLAAMGLRNCSTFSDPNEKRVRRHAIHGGECPLLDLQGYNRLSRGAGL